MRWFLSPPEPSHSYFTFCCFLSITRGWAHNWCSTGPQLKQSWLFGFYITFPQKTCKFGWLFSKHDAWKREIVFKMPKLLLVICSLLCPWRNTSPGLFHQHVLGLLVSSSIKEVRISVLLLMQLKVPLVRIAFLSANINEWQRSLSRGYQVSNGAPHGIQGTTQPDFLSRKKNKEQRHGICLVSSLIYCRITHIRHRQIAEHTLKSETWWSFSCCGIRGNAPFSGILWGGSGSAVP